MPYLLPNLCNSRRSAWKLVKDLCARFVYQFVSTFEDFTSMSTNEDEEYLDDPISLMTVTDIKKEICDEDDIINIQTSSDEEEPYTSSYGKKNFVLPVTFFDSTRNIRLLNKCKPMSISIVDCKQYPTYYEKKVVKNDSKCDDSRLNIDNEYKNDSEPASADAQDGVINTNITTFETDKRQEGEKKQRGPHSDSFYEKLKRRKESRKQLALNCKDLTQVDFKRNTGLVGLKITDTIFKNIVNTENKPLKTKKNSVDDKTKENIEVSADKPLITKENDNPEEKCKDAFESVGEKSSGKQNKNSDTGSEQVIRKIIDSTKDTHKEKSEGPVEKPFDINQCKRNTEENREKTSRKNKITPEKDKSIEKSGRLYMKEVGAVLDNLGTTIIPVTDTHSNNNASNNVASTDNIENNTIRINKDSAGVTDKLKNIHDIKMKCSLKISNKKIVEKVLKLKETKSRSKSSPDMSKSTIAQQSPKETLTKSQTVVNFNIKSSKSSIDGSDGSVKDKLQFKNVNTPVADSGESKQVDKPLAKEAGSKEQAGSNSPVIPCTTIFLRAGSLKSNENISSPKNSAHNSKKDVQPKNGHKNSLPPIKSVHITKFAMINQADISKNSGWPGTSKHSTAVTQTNVRASDTKDSSMCMQNANSNIKTLKITEYKPPTNYTFTKCVIDIKNNIPTSNLMNQNSPRTNPPKEVCQVSTPAKYATFSGNAAHFNNQTTNELIGYQTYPNLLHTTSPSPNPKFSGNNAIILRRPPSPPSRNFQNVPHNQGHPIQTVINHRPQFQPMMHSLPMRFRLPPPYPPPNYPPRPNYSSPSSNLGQMRSNNTFVPPSRMSEMHLRGVGMGLNHLRFPGPRAPGCRPPLPVPPRQDNIQMNLGPQPGQQSKQAKKDSFIGNTANGDPIKKINIPPPATETVNDKQMMLVELNNAVMSPELTANKPEDKPINDLKRKADPKIMDGLDLPVKPKWSKPCPLSKKVNAVTDLKQKEENKSTHVGYSPPIKPILTYEESFQIFGKNNTRNKQGVAYNNKHNYYPSKINCKANILQPDNKEKKITHTDIGKDKAKKISFEDYRRRVIVDADRIDDKVRKHDKFKHITDDYNQDLGYDSDSTVKL